MLLAIPVTPLTDELQGECQIIRLLDVRFGPRGLSESRCCCNDSDWVELATSRQRSYCRDEPSSSHRVSPEAQAIAADGLGGCLTIPGEQRWRKAGSVRKRQVCPVASSRVVACGNVSCAVLQRPVQEDHGHLGKLQLGGSCRGEVVSGRDRVGKRLLPAGCDGIAGTQGGRVSTSLSFQSFSCRPSPACYCTSPVPLRYHSWWSPSLVRYRLATR